MDDIFVYTVKLPSTIHEAVLPCCEGYTIYLNEMDSRERQMKAYSHAIKHIRSNDWDRFDVQHIESVAHGL